VKFLFELSKQKILLIFLFVLLMSFGWAAGFKVVEDPRPTHVEKNFVKLVKVREIPPDINDKHFTAKPMSLAVAKDGSFFVYDYLVRKIFKFTKEGDLVTVFGTTGRGPGEFGKKPDQNWLYAGNDDFVYLSSNINRKVIKYDLNGKFVDEFVFRSPEYARGGFVPVVSAKSEFYVLNVPEHTIDILSKQGNHLVKKRSLLEGVDRDWSVILNVRDQDMFRWRSGSMIDLLYDFGKDDRLLVYLAKTSTLHVYQDKQLIKKYNVWPEQVLQNYRGRIAERSKQLRGKSRLIVHMFFKFFIDKDDPDHYYLTGSKTVGKKEFRTYRFSIDGALEKVLISTSPVIFHAKKNGTFYGIYKGSVWLYKEEADQ
jgi:hypothetical protein